MKTNCGLATKVLIPENMGEFLNKKSSITVDDANPKDVTVIVEKKIGGTELNFFLTQSTPSEVQMFVDYIPEFEKQKTLLSSDLDKNFVKKTMKQTMDTHETIQGSVAALSGSFEFVEEAEDDLWIWKLTFDPKNWDERAIIVIAYEISKIMPLIKAVMRK